MVDKTFFHSLVIIYCFFMDSTCRTMKLNTEIVIIYVPFYESTDSNLTVVRILKRSILFIALHMGPL